MGKIFEALESQKCYLEFNSIGNWQEMQFLKMWWYVLPFLFPINKLKDESYYIIL